MPPCLARLGSKDDAEDCGREQSVGSSLARSVGLISLTHHFFLYQLKSMKNLTSILLLISISNLNLKSILRGLGFRV